MSGWYVLLCINKGWVGLTYTVASVWLVIMLETALSHTGFNLFSVSFLICLGFVLLFLYGSKLGSLPFFHTSFLYF